MARENALKVSQSTRGAGLGRLLRRHLVHGAGREVETHARNAIEVSSSHADEVSLVGIVDRVDRAVLIDSGVAGREPVLFRRPQSGTSAFASVVDALPFSHLGVLGSLTVDGPGSAVVVRRRYPRLVIDVCEDLEAKILVLVEEL